MPAHLEIAATSVVVVGSFNPPIFQPSWFVANNLLTEEQADVAHEDMKAVLPELMHFESGWLTVNVTQVQCSYSSSESAYHNELRDLVLGTFTVLASTPVKAFGLNRNVHLRMDTEEEWHAIGDRLAPKEPWAFLKSPGVVSITMQEQRGDRPPDVRNVEFALSARVKQHGIYIGINDHYQLAEAEGDETVPAEELVPIVSDRWEPARERANEIVRNVLGES